MRRPAHRRTVLVAATALLTLVGASCTSSASSTPAATATGPSPVYVALGNGETAGNGVKDRIRDAWPQIVYRTELPASAIFVNFGETDATVADALADQLGPALALHPTVATVHLTDDRFQGTSVADYESRLTELVRRLRRGGRTEVVLGTVLPEDREPGVLACTADPPPDGPRCRIGPVDDPARSGPRVDAMNAAIRAWRTRPAPPWRTSTAPSSGRVRPVGRMPSGPATTSPPTRRATSSSPVSSAPPCGMR